MLIPNNNNSIPIILVGGNKKGKLQKRLNKLLLGSMNFREISMIISKDPKRIINLEMFIIFPIINSY